MAMKSPQNDNPHLVLRLIRYLINAPAALSILWPALLIVLGYVAWHRWGAERVADQFYVVDASLIEITPPPPYVRSDIVGNVYRDTAMEGLSLLDSQATAKIASAFSMNPWIKRVVSVRKLPGGKIDLQVVYRRPVAMVLVEKPDPDAAGRSFFFPVDEDGVLLPTGEFARAEIKQFIHIVVPGVYATGQVGSPFGDRRVEAAAQLAALLAPFRDEAGIISIDVPGDPRMEKVPQLELTTVEIAGDAERMEKKRFWGSPPGDEPPGETTAQMKLHTLLTTSAAQIADLRVYRPTPAATPSATPAQAVSTSGPSSSQPSPTPAWQSQGRRVAPRR